MPWISGPHMAWSWCFSNVVEPTISMKVHRILLHSWAYVKAGNVPSVAAIWTGSEQSNRRPAKEKQLRMRQNYKTQFEMWPYQLSLIWFDDCYAPMSLMFPRHERWVCTTCPSWIRNATASSHSGGNALQMRDNAGSVARKNCSRVSCGRTEIKHTRFQFENLAEAFSF